MLDPLEKFNDFKGISEKFKQSIKLFHIFDDYKGKNILFATNDDEVFAFGSNDYGQCGFGHNKRVDKPKEIPELNGKGVKKFFIGDSFVLALSESNQVYGWGKSEDCQLRRRFTSYEFLNPTLIPDLNGIIEISCGSVHYMALNVDQLVFSWGNNQSGQVGCGKESGDIITRPVQLKELPKIKSIHCYGTTSFAVSLDGLVYSWGQNRSHCLCHESRENIYEPKLINGLKNVRYVGCTQIDNKITTYFLTEQGKLYFSGNNEDPLLFPFHYQIFPESTQRDINFDYLVTIRSHGLITLALSNNNVYCLKSNSIEKIQFKTILDYCSVEKQITEKTIERVYIELGSGGFGVVYKILNRNKHNRVYALKIREIHEDEKIEEIMKHRNILLCCDERYVVKYYDYYLRDDRLYIEMELCSTNLLKVIEEKNEIFPNSTKQLKLIFEYFFCCQVFKELLEGVKYLHGLDPPIIHRNLKPQNILVNFKPIEGRFIKISDSELACTAIDNTLSKSFITKTTNFMAPELTSGNSGRAQFDIKADIYSLGQILYYLLGDETIKGMLAHGSLKNLKTENLLEDMTRTRSERRPDCLEILKRSESWLIGKNDVEGTLEINPKNGKFIKLYLAYKLKSENEIQAINIDSSDRFDILGKLGSGAFGEVFKARCKEKQEIFALKIIKMECDGKDISHYEREVQILLKCNENFVVKCFDSWIEHNKLYIQMELCSDNLKNIIQQKRECFNRNSSNSKIITTTEFFISSRIFKQILHCINYLHNFQTEYLILHRDLKPANILVIFESNNGIFIKLGDFGVATLHEYETFSQSEFVGTPGYSPPETMSDMFRPIFSKKTDVFSLGKILFRLLDFDLNKHNQDMKKNPDLESQWSQVDELAKKMISFIYKSRPNCADILEKYNFWDIDKSLVDLNLVRCYKNPFFYNFAEYILENV